MAKWPITEGVGHRARKLLTSSPHVAETALVARADSHRVLHGEAGAFARRSAVAGVEKPQMNR